MRFKTGESDSTGMLSTLFARLLGLRVLGQPFLTQSHMQNIHYYSECISLAQKIKKNSTQFLSTITLDHYLPSQDTTLAPHLELNPLFHPVEHGLNAPAIPERAP